MKPINDGIYEKIPPCFDTHFYFFTFKEYHVMWRSLFVSRIINYRMLLIRIFSV